MTKFNILRFSFLATFVLAVLFIAYYFDLTGNINVVFIRDTISGFGSLAPIVFILISSMAILLLFPGSILTISAGILFPFWEAVILIFIADLIGSTAAFHFSRFMGQDFINELFQKRFKKIKKYNKALGEKGFTAILFFRLIPIFPFNILNYTLALTRVKFWDYFWATFFGIIPGVIVYVYLGSSIFERNVQNVLFVISVILFMIILGYGYRKKLLV